MYSSKSLVTKELELKTTLRNKLKKDIDKAKLEFLAACRWNIAEPFLDILDNLKAVEDRHNISLVTRKLNRLYNGTLILPETKKTYFNLSDYQLSPMQKEVLNLGLNFHVSSKFDPFKKQCQIENLYMSIRKQQPGTIITEQRKAIHLSSTFVTFYSFFRFLLSVLGGFFLPFCVLFGLIG